MVRACDRCGKWQNVADGKKNPAQADARVYNENAFGFGRSATNLAMLYLVCLCMEGVCVHML